MKRQLLHTPEGVRDIYNDECEKKIILQDRLHRVLKLYGYHPIQTPTFEFFDIFNQEIGTIPSKELYKFFDREGNTLVLRPDITPSIARCAVKYYMEEDLPIRFSYMGNTFINNSSYQGRLKENTQLGAELIGDSDVSADAEIIAMAVDCLKSAGLKEFQISIGHADFLTGLMEAARLTEEEEEELRLFISNKNFFGVEEFVEQLEMDKELKQIFGMIGNFYNSAKELEDVKALAGQYGKLFASIVRLEKLDEILKMYHVDSYVSYELSVISDYRYYTGVIFSGYTFGMGEPIVKGGRYDELLSYFGKKSPSVGFAVVIDQLQAALQRQKIEIEIKHETQIIIFDKQNQKRAIEEAMLIRQNGNAVELILTETGKSKSDYEAYAQKNKRNQVTYMIEDETWKK